MRACILHLGTHKTGTTSIQALLTRNARAFARCGIYVPRAGRPKHHFGTDKVGHHNIAWELNGDDRFDPKDGTLQDLAGELAACRHEIAVVSSEDFEYLHAEPEALARIAVAIRSADFEVYPLVYLRAQRPYAISLYAELLNHGLDMPIERFVSTIREHGAFRHRERWIFQFRYSNLLDPLAGVFGHERIIARPYVKGDRDSYLSHDFLSVFKMFGSAPTIGKMRVPSRLNQSSLPEPPQIDDLSAFFQVDNTDVERRYRLDRIDPCRSAETASGDVISPQAFLQ